MSELYELPDGWEWEKLKNIIRIGCEKGFKPTVIDGKVPFIGMTDIDKYTGRNTKYILEDNDKVSKGKTKFQKNAILLGKITPCTQNNKTTIVPNEIDGGYATTEVYALHCLEKIVSLYLNYYIRSKRVNEFLVSSMIGATGRQRVPSNIVKNLDIPLPPLQEQKRIVAKLDALFEKIDRAIALHQKNMDEADVFMGSVLNDVFGELEKKYQFKSWNDILTIKNGKHYKDVIDDNGQYPIYGSGGIMNYANQYICNEDTVIIGRKGTINSPIFVKEKFWNIDTAFGIEANREFLIPLFLYYFTLKFNFLDLNKSTTLPSLAKTNLLKINMVVPPLKIQQKTVNYLDKISLHVKRVKEVQKEKMELLKALKASILDQAFRGKLN